MKRVLCAAMLMFVFAGISFSQIMEGYEKGFDTISKEDMLETISYLASDSLKGRPAGSDECKLAAMYIANKFRKAGLKPLFTGKLLRSPKEEVFQRPLNIEDVKYYAPYFQDFKLQFTELSPNTRISFSIGGSDYNTTFSYDYEKDFYVNYKANEDINLSGKIVFAGYGIEKGENGYNDFVDADGNVLDVKNKIVVIVDSYPGADDPNSDFSKAKKLEYRMVKFKRQLAEEKGALAVMVVQSPLNQYTTLEAAYGTSLKAYAKEFTKLHEYKPYSIPVIYLSNKASLELFGHFAKKDLSEILNKMEESRTGQPFEFDAMTAGINIDFNYTTKTTQNVAGFLEGSDPELKDEVIVVCGHYDHVGLGYYGAMDPSRSGEIHNGADDNASGTSGVIELAEAMSQNRPKRSILFIAYSAEENGIFGSRYYVRNSPIFPLEKTIACVNMDMIGRNETQLVWVGGAFQGRDIIKTAQQANEKVGMELLYNVGFLGKGSDQAHFLRKEIPSVFFFSGFHDDYHTPDDDIEKLNMEKAEKIAKLAYLTTWILGNQDENPKYEDIPMPERAKMVKESVQRVKKYRADIKKGTLSTEADEE